MTRWSGTARGRAVFAAQARQRFDAGAAELRPVVKAAIEQYLAKLRGKVAAHGSKYLTAAAPADVPHFTDADAESLLDVLNQAKLWGPILDSTIMPKIAEQLTPILKAGMASPQAQSSLIAWRNKWLADRRQVLTAIPDQITSELRTALQGAAAVEGTSVFDAGLLVDKMLDDGYPSWANRADLIARTETVGANNQGSLAAFTELSSASGSTATKTWLATDDERTREDHADVDGMTVAISDTFDVGGDAMNGPGDPAGGAAQVCNCRCTLTYAINTSSDSAAADTSDATAELDTTEGDAGDESLAASAADPPTGVAIMARLMADCAQAFAVDGGEPADEMHVTLAYLAEPIAELDATAQHALIAALMPVAATLPVTATAFATAEFNPNSDPDGRQSCAVVLVQGDDLAALHDAVEQAVGTTTLTLSEAFPTWIPHVTVAYGQPTTVISADLIGGAVAFDELIIGWGGTPIVVGKVDSSDENGGDQLTAAPEAPVTAPAMPAPNDQPEATGGDTPAPVVSDAALEPEGITWSGPLAILNTPSSDNRVISATGGVIRPLPQPLSWQRESSEFGHEGSIVVARILAVEVRGNQLWGSGDWMDPNVNFDVMSAMAQVDAGLGFISVDLAVHESGVCDQTGQMIDPILYDGDSDVYEVALSWELGGATILSFPAFADARIQNEVPQTPEATGPIVALEAPMSAQQSFTAATPESPTINDDGTSITLQDGSTAAIGDPIAWSGPDGTTITGTIKALDSDAEQVTVTPPAGEDGTQPPDETVAIAQLRPVEADSGKPGMEGDDASVEASLIASAAGGAYKASNFVERTFEGPTPLTVDPTTGAVAGHIAQFGTCHVGKLAEQGKCVMPPEDEQTYDYFNLTPLPLDDGSTIYVGRITTGTGHAGPGGFRGAVAHYDHSGTQAAVVHAYRDKFGIAVVGQIVPTATSEQIDELMRVPISGDWRRMSPGGPFRLVAALGVNVPGFPVVPRLGYINGEQTSLVASGVIQRELPTIGEVVLPSGRTVSSDDFQALSAAMLDAATKHTERISIQIDSEQLALTRARLALTSTRRR